jgi:hypothetical protein
MGGGDVVVADLLAGLSEHRRAVADRWPGKAEPFPVVLGCVPWLTHRKIAETLAGMSGCTVVNKGSAGYRAVRYLSENGRGVRQALLGLAEWGPTDAEGRGPLIGPGGPMPGDRGLEAVRVLGYLGESGTPLLHAKMAVCCGAWTWENEGGGWDDILTPMNVWIGSANWTHSARGHIEFGAWSSDDALCQHALSFLQSVIVASEPLTSVAPGPMPELRPGEYDDDAFWDLYEEVGPGDELDD